MGQGAAPGTLENSLRMKWSEGMSQTQHAGLAFWEVADVGRAGQRTGQTRGTLKETR